MTVYELIQALARIPADAEVIVKRSGQRRPMEILSVSRNTERRGEERQSVTVASVLLDWKEPTP